MKLWMFIIILLGIGGVFAQVILVKPGTDTILNQSVLNTNRSNWWDNLDVPTDIPNSEFWYNHTLHSFNNWGEYWYNQSLSTFDMWNDAWSSTFNQTYDAYATNVSMNWSLRTFDMWNSTWDNSFMNTLNYNQSLSTFTMWNSTWDDVEVDTLDDVCDRGTTTDRTITAGGFTTAGIVTTDDIYENTGEHGVEIDGVLLFNTDAYLDRLRSKTHSDKMIDFSADDKTHIKTSRTSTDPYVVFDIIGGDIIIHPSSDGDGSLGTSSLKWQNLHLSGDANIGDDLVVTDDVDIGGDLELTGHMGIGVGPQATRALAIQESIEDGGYTGFYSIPTYTNTGAEAENEVIGAEMTIVYRGVHPIREIIGFKGGISAFASTVGNATKIAGFESYVRFWDNSDTATVGDIYGFNTIFADVKRVTITGAVHGISIGAPTSVADSTIPTSYGLLIADWSGIGTDSYSIKTTGGKHEFGDDVKILGDLNVTGNLTYNAIYIQASDLVDQTYTGTSDTQIINITTVDESYGITAETGNGTNFTISVDGVYNIVAQPQVTAGAGQSGVFHMWLQKDTGSGFADVSNTNIELSLGSQEEDVILLSTTLKLSAGNKIRLGSSVSNTGLSLDAQTPSGEPAIPSIIFTMYRVGN